MQERKTAEEAAQGEPESAPSSTERVRVTDRRRFSLDETKAAAPGESGAEEAPGLKPTYVEELEARTRAAEQKAGDVQARFEQVRSQLQREMDETRQRLNRAADERVAREKAAFVSTLLPVMDNLQRAIESAEASGSLEALLDGLRGTVNGFENTLSAAGAEPVPALGAQFDPELHEAVDTVETDAAQDGTVTAEYSRGYKMGGGLLRPARVQVGRARPGAQKAAE